MANPNEKDLSKMTPNELTPYINKRNVEAVQKMIEGKNSCCPYYATSATVTNVMTDMDHFPYNRFFRGVSYFPEPVVFEREAGWRELQNDCYTLHKPRQAVPYPNHCMQSACSTVFPCYPQYLAKYSDIEALDIELNKACIVQYR